MEKCNQVIDELMSCCFRNNFCGGSGGVKRSVQARKQIGSFAVHATAGGDCQNLAGYRSTEKHVKIDVMAFARVSALLQYAGNRHLPLSKPRAPKLAMVESWCYSAMQRALFRSFSSFCAI